MFRKLLLAILLVAPLGLFPLLRHKEETVDPPYVPPVVDPLTQDQRNILACFAISPSQSFPMNLPWKPLFVIGEERSKMLEELARNKPVEFLQASLDKYDRDVKGYRLLFLKQERVKDKLRNPEEIVIHFREEPFSVHFKWLKGVELATATLYVKGENNDKLIVRPVFLGFLMHYDVNSLSAKATSRFPITQFGFRQAAKNTLNSVYDAQKRDKLHLKYDGIKLLKQVDRLCYVLIRDPYDPPEDDGIAKMTIYIDMESLLHVGYELRDSKGETIADYYFRDIELNPTFNEKQFTNKGL